MILRTIEQVVLTDGRVVAQSLGVEEPWPHALEELVQTWAIPSNTEIPACLLTMPGFTHKQLVVTLVGRSIRVLIMERDCYEVIPDPFAIEERFPPTWDVRNPLPTLEWPDEPLPPRTTEQLNTILKEGDGPLLLGACQALVDSAKLLLNADEPQPTLLRSLWQLLPTSIQRQTTLATFAYTATLSCSLMVVPASIATQKHGYLSDEQARDYPESRYERNLQVAIEANDQRMLNQLLARKSSAEALRSAMIMLVVMAGLAVLARVLLAN